jgi:Tol biopolymer transport system component/DNA-binding winged helix-turn-helix (wHTH) protein
MGITNGNIRCYEFGQFRLEVERQRLWHQDEPVLLSHKAMATLLVLLEHPGKIVEREELLHAVWGDVIIEDANLTVAISTLRKVLGQYQSESLIETVPRLGYRFTAEVHEIHLNGNQAVTTESPVVAPPDAPADTTDVRTAAPHIKHLSKRTLIAVVTVLGVVLLGGGFMGYRMWHRPTAPTFTALTLSTAIPFTTFPGSEAAPAFSPDGKRLAFGWGGENNENLDIFIKQIEGEGLLRLTNHPASDNDPAWSPDGQQVAFTRYNKTESGIYVILAVGGTERRLTNISPHRPGGLAGSELSWSRDGKWLAFGDRDAPGAPLQINLLQVTSGERRVLTPAVGTGLGDFLPNFSPDGNTIAFARNATASDSHVEIFLVPTTGGDARQLTQNTRRVNSLAWLGNNHEILFSGLLDGDKTAVGLHQLDVRTGQSRRLSGPETLLVGGAYDPQNKRLCYTKADYDVDVMRIELDATASNKQAPTKLIGSTKVESAQQYSPDGKKLVYQTSLLGNETLWLCDSDGQNQRLLTNDPNFSAGWPNWSPDSKELVYYSRANGKAAIFAMAVETGQHRRITNDGFSNVTPSWSGDGKWIYFSSDRTGTPQIFKIPAAGGAPVQVTQQGGIDPQESLDGKFLVFVKNQQTPGLWRVDLATGQETLLTDVHKAGYWRMWDVTPGGVFFGTNQSPTRAQVEFYEFATGKVSLVTTLDGAFSASARGLCVSPDGQWLTYLKSQVKSDLMLTESSQ